MTLLTVTPPGGTAAIDYSSLVQSINVEWPATTDLPTCNVTCNNQGGDLAAVPLFSTLKIPIPGVGTFSFALEKSDFKFVAPSGGGQNTGRTCVLTGTAAPELVFLTEGNLDVVGTDLPVGCWNNRGNSYVPYASTYVNNLGSSLLDVGDLLTALLHTPQTNANYTLIPNANGQDPRFRGRLGYDATGLGVPLSGVDYTAGSLGLFIKGMWQCGRGSTGAQKTGLDIIRDVVTKNIIDSVGNLKCLDWYVDNTKTPSLVNVFERGSNPIVATLTVGTDPIQELDLPVDTTDIKNFVIYWSNPDKQYPNGGDAWSDYPHNAYDFSSPSSQWQETAWTGATGRMDSDGSLAADTTVSASSASGQKTVNVASTSGFVVGGYVVVGTIGHPYADSGVITSIGSGTIALDRDLSNTHAPSDTDNAVHQYLATPRGVGGSIRFVQSAAGVGEYVTCKFNLLDNGYDVINYPVTWFPTALNFQFCVVNDNTNNAVAVYLVNPVGGIVEADVGPITTSRNAWTPATVALPTSGTGSQGSWTLDSGSWDWATTQISEVRFKPIFASGHSQVSDAYWFDQISFTDNWQFSPTYSYNITGPLTAATTASASVGDLYITLNSVVGFTVGQFVVIIDLTTFAQELIQISSIDYGDKRLYFPSPGLTIPHSAGEEAIGATHDPYSIGADPSAMSIIPNPAYGLRIFNYVDFYATNGQAMAANSIALAILNSRKGKKSSGKIKVDGRTSQVTAITPGSRIKIIDSVDVYKGGTIDTTIDSWIVDKIEYNWVPTSSEGFTATFTVEPFYNLTIGSGSPDTNPRNLWMSRDLSEYFQRLYRSVKGLGVQK